MLFLVSPPSVNGLPRNGKVALHTYGNYVAMGLLLLGLIAICTNKALYNKPIIPQSVHAWAGAFASIAVRSGACCVVHPTHCAATPPHAARRLVWRRTVVTA